MNRRSFIGRLLVGIAALAGFAKLLGWPEPKINERDYGTKHTFETWIEEDEQIHRNYWKEWEMTNSRF